MWAERQVFTFLVIAQACVVGVWAEDDGAAEDNTGTEATIVARLENIEKALSNQGLLEMLQTLQNLEMEINQLRGDLEVQNHVLEQIKKRQRDLYTDIDRRLQRIESPLTTTVETMTGAAEPPLRTLSPFTGPEDTGAAQQADTPLTLELVGQEPADEPDIASPAAPPEQLQQPADEQVMTEPDLPAGASGQPDEQVITGGRPQTGADTVPPPVDEQATTGAVMAPAQDVSAPQGPEEAFDAVQPAPDPERVQADYQNAFNLLKQSRYDRAVTAFREFLARYPGSEYADNAQFWLGEAYFVNGYFEQALLEYNTLLQNYPESPKLAQAKLKAGFCQHELGRIEPAKKQLEELIQQSPGTTAARLAEERLKQITTATVPADMTPVN